MLEYEYTVCISDFFMLLIASKIFQKIVGEI